MRTSSHLIVCAFAAACMASLAIITPVAAPAATSSAAVDIENFTFNPAELTVHVGSKVTFTNGDDIPHQVVANDGSFRSKALDSGDSFAMAFAKPGTYAYFCGLHPHMQGKVIVVP